MGTEGEPKRVKVLFRLEKDEDGYPPVEVESLWGIVRLDGVEPDNTPFFARGVALGDIVNLRKASDGALEFESVARRGGHSTYRILVLKKHPEDPRHTMEEADRSWIERRRGRGAIGGRHPTRSATGQHTFLSVRGIDRGRWEVDEAYRALTSSYCSDDIAAAISGLSGFGAWTRLSSAADDDSTVSAQRPPGPTACRGSGRARPRPVTCSASTAKR